MNRNDPKEVRAELRRAENVVKAAIVHLHAYTDADLDASPTARRLRYAVNNYLDFVTKKGAMAE